MSWKLILLIIAMATILPGHPTRAQAGDWVSGSASNSSGSRHYNLRVPSGYDEHKPTPLLVMLHGCMQKPEDLAAISGMNEVADKNNFLVVYPEQTKEANPLRCWNWIVKGLGHAWSGSPAAAPFADPKGPNASEEMWRFFGETTLSSQSPKPKAAKPKGRV